MRMFVEVPQGGTSNDSGVVENGNFWRFRWLFSDTLEMRRALLYGDMQSVISFTVIPKCMTLNGYFALNSVSLPVWPAETVRLQKIIA